LNQQIQQKVNWKKGELLGFGAYGQVFLGLNEDSGQLLAVKQVPLVRERTKANHNV
jgi:serine/threonine protein kinase